MDRRKLTDEQLEALFAGKAPEGLESLGAFFSSVPDAYRESPAAALEADHLARMRDAATAAPSRSPHRARRRRKIVLSTIFSTLAAKIAAVTVAAAAATGGLAATNTLPPRAQDAVSTAMSHLGVHFPNSHAGGDSSASSSDDENQGKNDDANSHGKDVSDVARTTDPGPDHGDAVSDIASTNGQEHRSDNAGGANNPTGNGKPDTVPPAGPDSHPNGNPTGNGKPDSAGSNPTDHGKP